MTTSLDAWIETRCAAAVREMRRAVSAVDLVHRRPIFDWAVRPLPGSVLASPKRAHWDPEPDYFYHWLRDAAVVIDRLPAVLRLVDAQEAAWWRQAFHDHLAFNLVISDPDVPAPPANPLQARTRPDAHMYLRPDAVLRAISGRDRLAEPRFNPDATLDLQQWGRPQHDGPALRVLALLHVAEAVPDLVEPALDTLLARDLDFLCAVAGEPCIGPWEEAPERRHAFTLIVQWDALERGAERCRRAGDTDGARRMAEAASRAAAVAEKAFDPAEGGWFDCVETDTYDASVVLGILHAGRRSGPFAIDAPRTAATVAALERRFAVRYPINRGRTVPAIGRWADDVYFGGNPWFPTTLGFAELHYRIAAAGGPDASAAFARAEQWMALVREVAPEGDALPEQFDRAHGRPTGCLALTWSAAAFIGAAEARAAALQATGPVCVNPSADKPV